MSLLDLANLLHLTVFSLEKAIQEVMGKDHIVLTSHAAKYIAAIEKERKSPLYSGVTLDEAIKNFVDHTSGSDFYEHIGIKKISDERYQAVIEGCTFAKLGVHDTLDPQKDICPLVLSVAAIFKYVEPDRDVVVEPSRFKKEGCTTEIDFIKIISSKNQK